MQNIIQPQLVTECHRARGVPGSRDNSQATHNGGRTIGRRASGRRSLKRVALLAASLLLLWPTNGRLAHAQTAPITIELNKLEPLPAPAAAPNATAASSPGCRVYMVVTNPDPEMISQLRLDLVLFGTDGVIDRRVALDLGPLAPRKTSVRLFDLTGQPCDGIGRVLVNDVLGCQFGKREGGATEEPGPPGCMDRLKLSTRTKAELTK